MSDVTLENILALNQEISALSKMGFPTRFTSKSSQDANADSLETISKSLTLRSNLGQSLPKSIAENQDLPPIYRSALQAGLLSKHLSTTLDGICRQTHAEQQLRNIIGRSLIPPLIVAILAYFGFIALCLYYSPTIERMYLQVNLSPGFFSRCLMVVHDAMPYWATIFPLSILLAWILWRNGKVGWQNLIPGIRRYRTSVRNANFANQLSMLLANGASLSESLPIAAAVTGDQGMIAASQKLVEINSKADGPPTKKPLAKNPVASDHESLRALSPLLRWALSSHLEDQSLSEILQFAEKMYRQSATHRAASWRLILPSLIGAALGGLIVLAYGLSLFGPFAQLIQDFAY